jgi:hypothetical protein
MNLQRGRDPSTRRAVFGVDNRRTAGLKMRIA